MTSGIILTIFGGILAILAYLFAPFIGIVEDGVTIHATTVQNGYASHGCVGVPTPFAKKLFGIAPK